MTMAWKELEEGEKYFVLHVGYEEDIYRLCFNRINERREKGDIDFDEEFMLVSTTSQKEYIIRELRNVIRKLEGDG